MSGYATSKWAGEVLLREAHDLCGLPVTVFRCDMIMAETRYRGQLNLGDMVTRLILSVAATGLAPDSFYARDTTGRRARAHFDGLPVDFVTESISTLSVDSAHGANDFQTYHVVNPHDDGIGLDEYVDWIIDAGYQVQRIGDYEQWYERFDTALRNMGDRQRAASVLSLLSTFRRPQPAIEGSFATAQRFRCAVQRAAIGADADIPHIDKPVIVKYLSDMESLGLLESACRAGDQKAAYTLEE